MHVVSHRVDERRRTFEILQDDSHVAVQRVAHRITQQRRAMLGAEDEVDVQAGERLGHDVGRPFRALDLRGMNSQGVALGWG